MVESLPLNDPEWAWAPYRPDADHPWDLRRAAHLFRRAGFGASWSELENAVGRDPQVVLDSLMTRQENDEFRAASAQLGRTILASGNPRQLSAWWAYVMLNTPAALLEKTTLFWHGHFATSAAKVEDAELMYRQNQLLRQHALGDFAQLVHAIARDPAMLIYLDSATNRKAHPNENFARELMELFCLGEGNYSEADIRELARCFTGWEIRRGSFRFNRFQHDRGEKSVLGSRGTFPDGAAIDVVLDQRSGPQFIVEKLVHYFVRDEPALDESMIAPLAEELVANDWNVGPTIRRILGSQLFFSESVIGRKVRSPVDLLVGLLRSCEGTTNSHQLSESLFQLGHGLFYPPNVKGWEGGRNWINSSTLLGRANAVRQLLQESSTRFQGQNLSDYFAGIGATRGRDIVERLFDLMVAVPPPRSVRDELVAIADRGQGEASQRIAETIHTLSTLPEFQLG